MRREARSVPARFRLQFPARQLRSLAARYAYEEDGAVIQLGEVARSRGFFTRSEFLEVCLWKTVRSRSRVARNSREDVEEATRLALSAKTEALRIQIPQALNGVSWATASVLLHLAHAEPYPITDYRALEALGIRGAVAYTYPLWLAYVAECRRLALANHVDMRTLDRALWQWSKERSL